MTKKTAFWIFFLGTLSSTALFLVLTFDTFRQVDALTHVDKLTDDVVAGKRVWEKYNCNNCHTILGFGGYYAPDMTKAYRRLGAEGIRMVVKNPDSVFKDAWRKMPQQNLSDTEITNLISFLEWVSEIDNNDWPPQDSDKKISSGALRLTGVGMKLGTALFKEKGCISCHKLSGVGGNIGPDLDGAGAKYDIPTLKKYISNPQSVNPNSQMPPLGSLTDAELNALAEYLSEINK